MSLFSKFVDCQRKDLPELFQKQIPEKGKEVPFGFREITEKEFAQSHFFVYGPDFRQWIQAPIDGNDKPVVNVELYWFHTGNGWGLAHDYWAGKVRYFAFGCEHEWVERKPHPMHMHTNDCSKCGAVWGYDSSG